MNSIKVYKMNDYEWWASRLDPRETLDVYLKEYGLDEEDNPLEDIIECDIDKEGMWWETESEIDLKTLGDLDEIVNYEEINGRARRRPKFGNLMRRCGSVFAYIPFREAIERNGIYEDPFMIASTEW